MKRIALILPVLIAMACGPGEEETERIVRVRVQEMEPSTISSEVYANTRLEGSQEALVFASIPGTVEEVLVSEGDIIEAGTRLVKMDTDQQVNAGTSAALASVSAARANAENARANYARMQTLYDAGALSAQELDGIGVALEAAEAQLNQAYAGYTQARTTRDNAWIVAPFSGRVGRVWARAGNMSGSNPLLSLSGNGGVVARVLLPESAIFSLEPGQPAYVTVSAIDQQSIPGVVTAVSPTVDPVSGQVAAEVHFNDTENLLRPGLSGRVSIVTESITETMVLPINVLRRTRTGYQVAVVVNERADLRDITTGLISKGNIQITSGIEAGDQIIVLGQNSVIQDGPVEVVN
ncbi:MAG: efflux RND transporter periplasmic adaptor subunit [Candidatus Sabulitectum sp.]|nr:efflux RND transporter periplasmic adaptor subunit [Candidatus Sabulitectum sp.]